MFSFLSFKIALAILGYLNFHMNFRISLSVSTKKSVSWSFVGGYINSLGQFVFSDEGEL